MPYTNKIQTYVQLVGQTAAGLTKNLENWTGFLTTASRLYKYPFSDQLLIHAQNPQSTAVANFDIWTKRMRRYVRRGSKGMALVHVNNGYPRLQYVFDVSDTGVKNDSRNLVLLQYKDEYREAVTKALEERFGVSCDNGLPDQLEDIAARLAKDYWDDYHDRIMYELSGSSLDGMDELNVGREFCDTATVSTAYVLLSRCGFHPEKRFRLEDFQYLCDFNTQKLIQILGVAVNQAASQILHQIAVAIFQYERQKQTAQQSNVSGAEDNKTSASGSPKGQSDSQKQKPSVQEVYEHYKPVLKEFLLSDTAYQNACKNSDLQNAEIEGEAAVKRAADSIADLRFLKFFYDLRDFHNQILHEVFTETYPELSSVQEQKPDATEAMLDDMPTEQPPVIEEPCADSDTTPDMDGEPVEPSTECASAESDTLSEEQPSEADTLSNAQPPIAVSEPDNKEQETVLEPSDVEVLSAVDYQVGDTVYLEDTAYIITDIGLFDIQLRGPSQTYPIFRVESKERFEDMLRRDPRNVSKNIVLEPSDIEVLPAATNFVITDDQLGTGGPKEKFQKNMAAITVLKQVESEIRTATPEEQQVLSQYVGWGGIP